MIVELKEIVLSYEREQLEAWKAGDKSLIPKFVLVEENIENQPDYHFGEMFVLRHYHEKEGWKGFDSYALGFQYPNSERRVPGRQKIEKIIPPARLRRLRSLRATAKHGGGEPDLFLYLEDGRFKFVEVKKSTDRLREPQLTCIAQILAALRCEVDIVYVKERNRSHKPRVYVFDLASFKGWKKTT